MASESIVAKFQRVATNLLAAYEKEFWKDHIKQLFEDAIKASNYDAARLVNDLYIEAVEAFYNDYEPAFYNRRSESPMYSKMADAFNEEALTSRYDVYMPDEFDELVVNSLFNKNVMTGRKSDSGTFGDDGSLFDLTFMEGYHGGAKTGDKHPNAGVPTGRVPIRSWKYWGRSTPKMSEPPYEIFTKSLHSSRYRDKLMDIIIKYGLKMRPYLVDQLDNDLKILANDILVAVINGRL